MSRKKKPATVERSLSTACEAPWRSSLFWNVSPCVTLTGIISSTSSSKFGPEIVLFSVDMVNYWFTLATCIRLSLSWLSYDMMMIINIINHGYDYVCEYKYCVL